MQKWLVPALILVGSGLIALSIWSPKSQTGRNSSENEVALISEKTGDVNVLNNEMPEAVALRVNSSVNAKDIIRTADNSEASVLWKNEGEFRITEKSEVVVDQQENGQYIVIVRSGDIYIEKFGEKPSFWVRKDGQLQSAADFALSDRSKLSKLREPVPQKTNDGHLAQFEIENTLNAKKTDFFKCYGQVLQRNAQAAGSVLIAFTILNQGQATKVEISKSDIVDTTFKSCLSEVVARTQFKAFSGPPVTTVFPLKFE